LSTRIGKFIPGTEVEHIIPACEHYISTLSKIVAVIVVARRAAAGHSTFPSDETNLDSIDNSST